MILFLGGSYATLGKSLTSLCFSSIKRRRKCLPIRSFGGLKKSKPGNHLEPCPALQSRFNKLLFYNSPGFDSIPLPTPHGHIPIGLSQPPQDLWSRLAVKTLGLRAEPCGAQGLHLERTGGSFGMLGSNPAQLYARQSHPQCPVVLFICC